MYRIALLIAVMGLTLPSAKAELVELTTESNPNCNPCEVSVDTAGKIKGKIYLAQRPFNGLWSTVSLQIKMNTKDKAAASFPIRHSLEKLEKKDRDSLISFDLNGDSYQDLALQVSKGARQSLYYYFLYDQKSGRYVFLNPEKPLQLLEATDEGLKASGPFDPGESPYYEIKKNRLISKP